MSTTKSLEKVQSRTSKEIQTEISDLSEMKSKTFSELEAKRASFLPKAELDKLIIAEATGNAEASVQLVSYRTESDDAQRMLNLIDAIDSQLPELRRDLNKAELKESMAEEKCLGEKNQIVEEEIGKHYGAARKLLCEKWIPTEKERYSLRVKWGGGGRTPKWRAHDLLISYFGVLLHPLLDMPRKDRD